MAERCKKELYVEKYFGLNPSITNEETKIVTDFGQLVNLVAMFEENLACVTASVLCDCGKNKAEYSFCEKCMDEEIDRIETGR